MQSALRKQLLVRLEIQATNLRPGAHSLKRQNDRKTKCTEENATDKHQQRTKTEVVDGRLGSVRHRLSSNNQLSPIL